MNSFLCIMHFSFDRMWLCEAAPSEVAVLWVAHILHPFGVSGKDVSYALNREALFRPAADGYPSTPVGAGFSLR